MTGSSTATETISYQTPATPGRVGWSDWLLNLTDRFRLPVFIAILLIYLAGFSGQWRPEPDAALYLSVGRNLAEGNGYTYHGEPHLLAYPGLPWLWALVFLIAPEHAMLAAHGLMLLMGLAALALCYRLFLLHAGRPMAVWMTLGLAISRLFYRYCFELRSDVPFLLGVLAFLAGFEAIAYPPKKFDLPDAPRRRPQPFDWLLMVGGLAFAVVMRPTMWALLGAALFATGRLLFMGRKRWALAGVVIVAAVVLGFLRLDPRRVGNTSHWGQYEQAVLQVATEGTGLARKVFTENIPGLFEPAASEAMFGLDMGLGLNTFGSLIAIAIGLSLFQYRFLWGMFYLFTVLMMIAVLPLDRYFLAVLPLTVYGWWRFIVWVERKLPGRWGTGAFVVLLLLGSGTNVSKIAKWIFEQHQRPFLVTYKDGRFVHYPELGERMQREISQDSWIVSPWKTDRVITFYSRRNVVEPGGIDPQKLRLLADVDRAYVLNPNDPTVKAWLEQTTLKLGDPLWTIGDPATNGWALYPVQYRFATTAPATTTTGATTQGGTP
jgi:hypothetical protein